MKRMISKAWTREDLDRLLDLAEAGATLLRASAALGRHSTAVQKKPLNWESPFRVLGSRGLDCGRRGLTVLAIRGSGALGIRQPSRRRSFCRRLWSC
jgi:hypothetical protein